MAKGMIVQGGLDSDDDLRTAHFIAQACRIHGASYGYEEARYIDTKQSVRIRCLRHGVFTQNAGKHLRGHGCRRCGDEARGAKQSRLAGEAFLRKARAVHGDRYSYDNTTYRSARSEVSIRCLVHGPFFQEARVHLAGSGCRLCGTEAMAQSRLTKAAAQYINQARTVHKDRYSYDETIFKGSRQKVSIRCSDHGVFRQYPHTHLKGSGCRKCAAEQHAWNRSKTSMQFIADARRVHGHLYDYSAVIYQRRSSKITILCATHGPFEQGAGHHLQGRGCPQCGNLKQADAKRRSEQEFVDMAVTVHGDRYGYENVKYKDMRSGVTIRCRQHEDFTQIASIHLKGSGCPRCAAERAGNLRRKDTPTFIKDARAVHGSRYSYDLVEYIANNRKVTIICHQHSEFEVEPANHLNGQNCPTCRIDQLRLLRTKKQSEFLEEARELHGPRYDYSKTIYQHSLKKISITCRIHDVFDQLPSAHLQGHGCPRCNHAVSKPETEWLDTLGIHERSYLIPLERPGRKGHMVVDGYDPDTRTVYLFHGDYWHGNPAVFSPHDMNHRKGKTYGDLYRITLEEERLLRDEGFNVITIWEQDYRAIRADMSATSTLLDPMRPTAK